MKKKQFANTVMQSNEELVALYRAGDRNAAELLLKKNRGVIMKAANKLFFSGVAADMGAVRPTLEEFEQIASLALLDIARRHFKPEMGLQFNTYAYQNTFNVAFTYLRSTGMVKYETNKGIQKVKAFQEKFRREHGRFPTTPETAEGIGVSEKKLAGWDNQKRLRTPIPLDSYVYDGEKKTRLVDCVEDEHLGDLSNGLILESDSELLGKALAHLDSKRRFIILSRIVEEKTLEEVGIELGVTRERVRQIEQDTLDRLKIALTTRDLDSLYPHVSRTKK
ncbi:MAG: sigma-70 family RNA polymerase sigma factor [Patescibacteria group bacterium]